MQHRTIEFKTVTRVVKYNYISVVLLLVSVVLLKIRHFLFLKILKILLTK